MLLWFTDVGTTPKQSFGGPKSPLMIGFQVTHQVKFYNFYDKIWLGVGLKIKSMQSMFLLEKHASIEHFEVSLSLTLKFT